MEQEEMRVALTSLTGLILPGVLLLAIVLLMLIKVRDDN
jgi:hypothetical protein